MSNYTSLETSKRLYEAFPGWCDALAWWEWSLPDGEPYIAYPELERRWGLFSTQEAKDGVPAYDTDYLLEKLPAPVEYNNNDCAIEIRCAKGDKYQWSANIRSSNAQHFKQVADTPAEALGLLALTLREEGLL